MSFLFNESFCNSVKSFDSLVPFIEGESFDLLTEIYSNAINNFDEFKEEKECIDNQYIKIKITGTEWFDCYLIIWKKNGISKIHDHADNGCLYKIIRGSIKEEKYSNISLNKISEKILEEGCVNYIDNQIGYHRMSNEDIDTSVSIHFYSPPNYSMNTYN